MKAIRKDGFEFDYLFLINILSTSAAKVNANSITKVAVYPPVASSTLFDAVATNEPTITVKVISAILPEKYFIPKKVEVNAEVMVGQAPYDIPVRHTPTIHNTREFTLTDTSTTAAAAMVSILAHSIVFLRPILSKSEPVRMRPKPLHTDSTPTRETANDSGAFTDSAKSLAKLITELPTAAKKEMQRKAIQKEGR